VICEEDQFECNNECYDNMTTTADHTDCWGAEHLYFFNCYWEECNGEPTITKAVIAGTNNKALGDPNNCGECGITCDIDQRCECNFDISLSEEEDYIACECVTVTP
jgi:hypothetical protein